MNNLFQIDYSRVGIMQGRLVSKYKGRYQAHPPGYWQKEFEVAAQLKLGLIEFILDYEGFDKNPLMTKDGIKNIQQCVQSSGVGVRSVCADYFMEAPLHGRGENDIRSSQKVLDLLILHCAEMGITDIVIPCVDQSSLQGKRYMEEFSVNIRPALSLAERKNIRLCLETDLPPQVFVDFLDAFSDTRIYVNYDIGNSSALGFDPVEEFKLYGDKITDIHIKDRMRNGGSVVLGTGNADFERFSKALSLIDFRGIFIFQAFRDDEGVEVFKRQMEWTQKYLTQWLTKEA